MLEAGSYRGDERLEEFWLLDLLEEAQRRASNVLVGMLQIVTDGVDYEDHLLLELSLVVVLGADFPVEVKHLLDLPEQSRDGSRSALPGGVLRCAY